MNPDNLEVYQHFLTFYFNKADEIMCREVVTEFLEKLKQTQPSELENYDFYFFLFFIRLMIQGAMWEESLDVLATAFKYNEKNLEGNYLMAFCYY